METSKGSKKSAFGDVSSYLPSFSLMFQKSSAVCSDSVLRKKAHPLSFFPKKGSRSSSASIVVEPASPTVTCIGSVRTRTTKKGGKKNQKKKRSETRPFKRFNFGKALKQFGRFLGNSVDSRSTMSSKTDTHRRHSQKKFSDSAKSNGLGCQRSRKGCQIPPQNVIKEEEDDEIPWAADALRGDGNLYDDGHHSTVECAASTASSSRRSNENDDPFSIKEKDDHSQYLHAPAWLLLQSKPGIALSLDVCRETWLPNIELFQKPGNFSGKNGRISSEAVLQVAEAIRNLPAWKESPPIHALILSRSKSEPGKLSAKIASLPGWPKRGKSVGEKFIYYNC